MKKPMRVLFFAQLKDVTGCAEVTWSGVGPLSGDEIWQRLEQQWPSLSRHRPVTRLARNQEFVGVEAVFQSKDEIALIPPVSGG
jgi:molybdopterin converting factor small subunit